MTKVRLVLTLSLLVFFGSKVAQSQTLTGADVHLVAGNDGLDSDSTFQVKLYSGSESNNLADLIIAHTPINKGDVVDKSLSMHNNTFQKSNINNATVYLQIDARGRDHFEGNLTVSFHFSDGAICSFGYGGFGIGTYHESNTTRKNVQISCN